MHFHSAKSIVLPVLLAMLCNKALAQDYSKTHIALLAGAEMHPRAKVISQTGNLSFDTRVSSGFHGGLSVTFNFEKRMALKTGFVIGIKTINYQYKLNGDQYNLAYGDVDVKHFHLLNLNMQVPLLFVYRVPINQTQSFGFDAGLNLKLYRPGQFSSDTYNADSLTLARIQTISYIEVNVGESSILPALDFQLMPFWHLQLNNHRILQLGILATIPITKHPYSGRYEMLPNTAFSSSGSYQVQPASVGIEVAYVFTQAPNPKRQNKSKPPRKSINISI